MKTILVDALNTFILRDVGINQEMHILLESFPNKKIVVTNANDEQMKTFGIDKVPYELFTLKHNPNKPDPSYFSQLLEKFNLQADEVIYFEHNEDALKSAQSLGITTHHYDKDEKDLVKLREFLTNNL